MSERVRMDVQGPNDEGDSEENRKTFLAGRTLISHMMPAAFVGVAFLECEVVSKWRAWGRRPYAEG